MSRKHLARLAVALTAILAILLLASVVYVARLPDTVGEQETIVLGQTRFVPGSQAALRVAVRNARDSAPVPGAAIAVTLAPQRGPAVTLFDGQADADGNAQISFRVPQAESAATLRIEVRSALGQDTIERAVTLQRDYKILLATDKPIYQPGQTIHIRALALSSFDLIPAAGRPITFTVADARSNKVFRHSAAASAYGVASADFTLADQVNTGVYHITAEMGNTSSERTVRVERYVLPKFKVEATTDRRFYLPGERVTGHVAANYFFGKPVEGGQVTLTGYVFDVQRQEVVNVSGQTDANGGFDFAFDLPTYFVGGGLEQGQSAASQFILEAAVTDGAAHTERVNLSLPVAGQPIQIDAVPESGSLRPGVENIVYVITSYPDGAPAQTELSISVDGQPPTSLSTGEYGLAEFRFTPQSPFPQMRISARDASGHQATVDAPFEGEWQPEGVLLRPERAAYRVGETLRLDVFTSQSSGLVYLDVVREGQTVSTRALKITNGRAEDAIDLTPDLFGTLELHAYKVLPYGQIVRDTRLVLVDAPAGLDLKITADRPEYRPGDTARLDFLAGAQSALGLAIVDESVFALQEQDPGFAKLYFLLERELMEPKYDIHGFTPAGALRPADEPALRDAQQTSAKAALAKAMPAAPAVFVQTHEEKLQQAYAEQARLFGQISQVFAAIALVLPLGMVGLTFDALRRRQQLARTLAMAGLALIALILVLLALPGPEWATTPLEKLGYLLSTPLAGGLTALLMLAALFGGLGGLAVLVAHARRSADRGLNLTLALGLVYFFVVLPLLLYTMARGQGGEPDWLVLAVLAYLLVPLALGVRALGFALERQHTIAVAAGLTAALAFFCGLIPALAVGFGGFALGAGAPLMRDGGIVEERQFFDLAGQPPMLMPMMGMPAAQATMAPAQPVEEAANQAGTSAAQPPRLRQFFPETMVWLPEAVTDESGHLALDVPLADSITTWRLSAIASTQDGRIGAATLGLKVFQDFFVDLDLPVALTQGDEIAVPVAVYNYLLDAQTVQLALAQSDWFTLLDQPEKSITIAPNDVEVVYFRLRAERFGRQALQVTATGAKMSDAILKEVTVHPDGMPVEQAHSDRLGASASQTVIIPTEAVAGTARIEVKIYPGIVSQVVEGLESILQMPFGCFEQTSSTTYPNVLVADYLQATNQGTPELLLKAEQYINLGYQRLTTFEVGGGGFSLFGDPPPDRMLTAYGLQEFHDMSRVHDVDPDLIRRAAEWLLAQQASDGSWENDRGLVHETTWQNLQNDRLPVTAYIVWSLADAGFAQDERVQRGVNYIRSHLSEAGDAYVLALVANALVAAAPGDPATTQALDSLAALAQQEEGATFWKSGVATMMGGKGQTGSVETTALAAYAFIRAQSHADLANGALTYLVRNKDPQGTWYTTQATVLALKALLLSVSSAGEGADATVYVRLNGRDAAPIRVTPANFDVVQAATFDDVSAGENRVEITVEGQGNLMYQVATRYYLPWSDMSKPTGEPMSIRVDYDRSQLQVNDTVAVTVSVALNAPGTAQQVLVDLGVAPGFEVMAEDLSALVARDEDRPADDPAPRIQRYELTGRQILVYIQNLSSGQPLTFSYRLRARFPIVAQIPASRAYDYYSPDLNATQAPQPITVNP